MCSSPSAFQWTINMALQPLLELELCVLFDNRVIRIITYEMHKEVLQAVIKRLLLYNLRGQMSKRKFLKDDIEFLGHELS
jgi:hypothetical protein